MQRFRRLIETVIGQLVERFHIEKIRARDMWHLTSRLNRKIIGLQCLSWKIILAMTAILGVFLKDFSHPHQENFLVLISTLLIRMYSVR
ncbi:hypothetical protein FDUTEX481_00667 [Tolypothrix sp. PCC 7601]|nr:hypothetical protein FDUTEX481_00667 [Tolypothrix sp. PCC 7601]